MSQGLRVISYIQVSVGEPAVQLGQKGRCRFCGSSDAHAFRNTSHTFPEALGNKWLVSLDECDSCNRLFSKYDDALAKSIGVILTVGGTLGKENAVRQTGRTQGPVSILHSKVGEARRISFDVRGMPSMGELMTNAERNKLQFSVPVPVERFVPRYAYKALVKMALAILPEQELPNFGKLRAWLCNPDDLDELPNLLVGLSFGSVGNAPPLAAAALLTRTDESSTGPYMIFVMTIGSVCWQIDLKSDALDGGWPPLTEVRCGIRWNNVLAAPGREETVIRYGEPTQLNWASRNKELSPIESLVTTIDLTTNEGSMRPVFRTGDQ